MKSQVNHPSTRNQTRIADESYEVRRLGHYLDSKLKGSDRSGGPNYRIGPDWTYIAAIAGYAPYSYFIFTGAPSTGIPILQDLLQQIIFPTVNGAPLQSFVVTLRHPDVTEILFLKNVKLKVIQPSITLNLEI